VGDYRVLLDIEDGVFRVLVLKVGHRTRVYSR
jgi:mRNA-degrading endonuclease RelE of RelBE toxin-antitoxin system